MSRPHEYAATEDLADELMTRGDAVVILISRPRRSKPGNKEIYRQISGSAIDVKGLLHDTIDYARDMDYKQMLTNLLKELQDGSDDETHDYR